MSRPIDTSMFQRIEQPEGAINREKRRSALRSAEIDQEQGLVGIEKIRQDLETARTATRKTVEAQRIMASGAPPAEIYKGLLQVDPNAAEAYRGKLNTDSVVTAPDVQQTQQFDLSIPASLDGSVAASPMTGAAPAKPRQFMEIGGGMSQIANKSAADVAREFAANQQVKTNANIRQEEAEMRTAAQIKADETVKLGPGDMLVKDGKATFTNPPLPKTQTEYDQQLGAFNSDKDLVSKFGQGPVGFTKWHASMALESAKAGAQAREDAKKSDDLRLANVDPRFHSKVLDDVQKAESAYIAAQKAADDMTGTVAGAQKGNKVAASYSPVIGVLTINAGQGVKRINRQEIEQYQGAGSLFDRIAGWAGKQVEGQPIPKNILDDMASLTQILTANSKTQRDRTLQSIDNTYRSNFSVKASSPSSTKTIKYSDLPK